jgi:hypothetical protein
MDRLACISLLIFALLSGALADVSFAASKGGQTGYLSVIVNGRRLTGPNSAAQKRAGRISVPVAAIARSFGDTLSVEPGARSLRLERRDGVSAVFDATSGQVRENGVAVLAVSSRSEIVFTPNPAEIELPIEIASSLFGASMRYDSGQDAVIVTRGNSAPVSRIAKGRRAVELYRADFELNASGYSGSVAQNLTVTAAGRVGDARLLARAASSGTSLGQVRLRNVTVDVERPNGQHFTVGDVSAGVSLPLVGGQIRGASASATLGGIMVTAFGGKAQSGPPIFHNYPEPPNEIVPAGRSRFDTYVFGVTAIKSYARLSLAAGGMRFNTGSRGGDIASSTVIFNGAKLRAQADLAVGRFHRANSDEKASDAAAMAIDVTSTYQVSAKLALHARFAQIGRDFLTPQSGVREPITLRAAGATYSPVSWLSASVNASTARRPGDTGRAESYVTTAVSISPGGDKPRGYFSHTVTSSRLFRSGSFSLLNASKEFRNWRLYLNATRIKTVGPAAANVQVGANVAVSDTHAVEVTQGFGSRRAMNGMLDWRASNFLGRRLGLTAGVGYNYSPASRLSLYERVTASVRLPRENALQVSYMHTVTGPAVLVQLRGSIFKRREAAAFVNAPVATANSLSTITGRVYQDNDGNGAFDLGVDVARAEVKVRLDGARYATTDADGNFSFDAVPAGRHSVYLDLLSVRADLTLIDGAAREVELDGGRTSGLDFRLVRTGRVAGRVFFDQNGNGTFDDGESPLADIRVVTAGGRDTLTDADGYYVIADLPPGEHVVFIDEKTLPEKTVAGTASVTANVFAGKETGDVDLISIAAPAEVKRFGKRD